MGVTCRSNHHSLVVLAIQFSLLLVLASAFEWRDGDNGQVTWSNDCEFNGNNIDRPTLQDTQCGGACVSNNRCTHFTWISGTCYLKHFDTPGEASGLPGAVCGWVNRNHQPAKPSGQSSTLKGTMSTFSQLWLAFICTIFFARF